MDCNLLRCLRQFCWASNWKMGLLREHSIYRYIMVRGESYQNQRGRLIGGRQFDRPWQNVMFRKDYYQAKRMLALPRSFSFPPFRPESGSVCFYGSQGEEGSVIFPSWSLLAVLAKCILTLSAMKSLVAWSKVGGNSSSMFLLEGLEVFDCFLIASTPKKSRLLYSLVYNFLLRKEGG